MDLLFSVLESLQFISSSLDGSKTESKMKGYIYNTSMNEDKNLFFVLIIMLYVSYHDDLYISAFEKKGIEEYLSKHVSHHSKEYLAILEKVKGRIWTLKEVVDYCEYNHISLATMRTVLDELEGSIFNKEKYKELFSTVRNALKLEEKYLQKMLTISK